MITTLTLRFRYLLVPFVLLAACDNAVGPLESEGGQNQIQATGDSDARAALFSGPDVSVFEVGSNQIVDYFVEHPEQKAIDVSVLEFPDGAKYTITDQGGSYSKKISLTWSPGYGTDGSLHAVTMLAHTREDGTESLGNFDIYVNGADGQ